MPFELSHFGQNRALRDIYISFYPQLIITSKY